MRQRKCRALNVDYEPSKLFAGTNLNGCGLFQIPVFYSNPSTEDTLYRLLKYGSRVSYEQSILKEKRDCS